MPWLFVQDSSLSGVCSAETGHLGKYERVEEKVVAEMMRKEDCAQDKDIGGLGNFPTIWGKTQYEYEHRYVSLGLSLSVGRVILSHALLSWNVIVRALRF